MSLNGYLIEKYNNMANAYTCHRILSVAYEYGIELKLIGVHDTCISRENISNYEQLLSKRDFVINRYKWGKVKDTLNLLGRRSYNNQDANNLYVNKFEQVNRLHSDCFSIPKFLLVGTNFPYDAITSQLGSPFVFKGLESSKGREIFLVENEQYFNKLRTSFGEEKEFLCEEFITTSIGRDLRLFSIRGEAVACMMRQSNSDFRANFALGATLTEHKIDDNLRAIAYDIYVQTGLDFVGIDLMFGSDKYWFCEINITPGLEGIEKISKTDIAGKIINTIKNDFE
jgi:RimK family alpha-L-glutamate ligase